MLAPIEGPVETRPLIIDCKTASADLDTNLIRLDPQLAEYAWQLQIFDVAFLWFVKRSHELKKGDKVTLLQSVGSTHAGTNGYVLNIDKKENKVLVGDSKVKAQFEDGKRFFQRSDVLICEPTALTKQRLQFSSVRLTDTEVREVGQRIGFDTVQMVESHRTGFYPKLGGIRFPNQKCNFCEMRGICLDQPDLRDALLTRAGEEWLDGDED
jgi:ribosomal protein L24